MTQAEGAGVVDIRATSQPAATSLPADADGA